MPPEQRLNAKASTHQSDLYGLTATLFTLLVDEDPIDLYDSDAQTELVAEDSAFVAGTTMAYLSGVVTDTALEPEHSAEYHVRVNVAKDNPVSYITREIHWERMD